MSRENHLQRGSKVSPFESIVAGSLSGAVARAVTAPLDTIKIRLQLQTTSSHGIFGTFNQIYKHEGILALWKGNVPAEIMYILYGAVQFTSYSMFNNALTKLYNENENITLRKSTHSLIVGTGAGISSTCVTYPFDLLRTRLAANKNIKLLSMTSTIRNIYQLDGFKGFFIGIKPAVLSVASNTGLMFWTYEIARELSVKYNNFPFIEGLCGFVAGATAKGITFPLDTLRKRMQMKTFDLTLGSRLIHLCKSVIVKEGILGLYKGFGISILKTAPTSAISLFIYEYVLSMMKHTRH